MKKILGGLAVSIFLAAPAMAADMRMPVKAPPAPVVTLYSWTGCYIGGHVGYAWSKRRVDHDPALILPLGFNFDHEADGFVAGGQVGCNFWQNDRWVWGVEGQVSWADMDHEFDAPLGSVPGGRYHSESDIIGSLALRLGYAFGATGQTLLFVKGGAAFINERHHTTHALDPFFNFNSDKELRWGWMVGAGLEQALGSNWSFKVEYNYSHFGSNDIALCNGFGTCLDFEVRQHVHLVKVGLNYRFGGFGGPVVARY